ncbi:RHS repeat-associated core domain-containing protein [Stenotrophomonas sp. 364]|uniref:RHS repeat-associated core domain-containing protein n=1 Tax=Stenotrophomonas sp. 364 TaxID=2691571 RepID=UPI0013185014|nr:RHS repeat-associated core domain-containing protein [Stenotrophomonas sp. 364]QHB70584.1 hypothetical protein GQ674_04290 [Stenotrophomonas sp. 364]
MQSYVGAVGAMSIRRRWLEGGSLKLRCIAAWLCCVLLVGWSLVPTASAQTVTYIHTDALGSVVAETNANGSVIKRYDYEPYGAVEGAQVADGPGYTGHVSDSGTGLSYMQQRYYDPQLGRFLSADPVEPSANKGQNFSRYKYANNNPYRFTDPDGRQERSAERFGDAFAENPGAFEQFGPAAVVVTQIALSTTPVVGPLLGPAFRQIVKEPVAPKGTAGGPRAGKDFTPAGKREVIQKNEQENGGQATCEGCTVATSPAQQSQRGIPTPKHETRVDHITPKSKGGDGSPSNGQVLCSSCNIDKSNKVDWVPPKDRMP